jgi:hypothetical protein
VTESNTNGVHRDAFLMQRVGVGLAEAVKFSAFDTSFLCNRLQLAQEVSVGFSVSVGKNQIVRLGIPLSHSVLDLPNQLCRDRNESVLGGLLFLFALEAEMPPRFRLDVQRTLFPVEVCVLSVLHFGVPHARI